jgi:hypothetical protein
MCFLVSNVFGFNKVLGCYNMKLSKRGTSLVFEQNNVIQALKINYITRIFTEFGDKKMTYYDFTTKKYDWCYLEEKDYKMLMDIL